MSSVSVGSRVACRLVGAAFDAVRKKFPPVVRVETTNACNAKCIICPHREMRRAVATMEDGIYRPLVEECAEAGCRELHLHNFGEPMLDKRIEERIAFAKQKGIQRVRIFCNGSLLTPARAKGLIEAGLDDLKISFDGATREEFERIRTPLRFDAVVQNIVDLVRLRNAMGSKLRVRVACCSTTDREGTMQSLEKVVDAFSFGKLHNWGGQTTVNKRMRKPCSRLWRTFTVLANGDVSLCCLDYDGRQILGRLGEGQSIRDIWNGSEYRRIRAAHRSGRQQEVPLCAACTKAFW